MFISVLLDHFLLCAPFALLLTLWLVARTDRDLNVMGKAAPQWCARSSSATQSTTCRIGPRGVSTFVPGRAFAAADAATAATTATGKMGLVCYSITRRGQGMGSLERGRAAQQWRRFQQGSVPGDAGCPSAFDALPSLEQ